MDIRTKSLLIRSLNEFENANHHEQDIMIGKVKNSLQIHERGIESIGMGYAAEYVRAGKIFLRIYKNR